MVLSASDTAENFQRLRSRVAAVSPVGSFFGNDMTGEFRLYGYRDPKPEIRTECPSCRALIVIFSRNTEELTELLLHNPKVECSCGNLVPHDVLFDAMDKDQGEAT